MKTFLRRFCVQAVFLLDHVDQIQKQRLDPFGIHERRKHDDDPTHALLCPMIQSDLIQKGTEAFRIILKLSVFLPQVNFQNKPISRGGVHYD